MIETKPALTVDARGLSCPMPIIRTKRAIGTVAVGETIEVLATDPGSAADFPAWTEMTGHELVASELEAGVYRFYIRRAK